MRLALTLHPDSRCEAATAIAADVSRPGPGGLVLRYFVTGKIGDLRLPPMTFPGRADRLWERSCFEAFVRAAEDAAYYEFNAAPSMQWAAYRFSGYRAGMTAAQEIRGIGIEAQSNATDYELQATLEFDSSSNLLDEVWHLGLSAVIEEANGRKSYWALAHPPGKPDFHHPDCFAFELAGPSR
jgi:hypothetical protein